MISEFGNTVISWPVSPSVLLLGLLLWSVRRLVANIPSCFFSTFQPGRRGKWCCWPLLSLLFRNKKLFQNPLPPTSLSYSPDLCHICSCLFLQGRFGRWGIRLYQLWQWKHAERKEVEMYIGLASQWDLPWDPPVSLPLFHMVLEQLSVKMSCPSTRGPWLMWTMNRKWLALIPPVWGI